MKFIFTLCILFVFSSQADDFLMDQTRVVEDDNHYINDQSEISSQPSEQTNDNENDVYGGTVQNTGGFNVTKQGGLSGANDMQSKGGGVQMMGLAMAGMYMSQCGTANPWACAAAALSVADALAGREAKGAGIKTGSFLDSNGGIGVGGSYGGDYSYDTVADAQLDDLVADLKQSGYTINSNGSVTGPDGNTVTAEDFSTEEALQQAFAGQMSANQASKAMAQIKKARQAAAKKVGMDLPEDRSIASVSDKGSGSSFGEEDSGKGSAYGGIHSSSDRDEIVYKRRKKKTNKLSAKKAAMLKKNFRGDPIGIGMADLFLIVHQKYSEKKNNKNEFINREY